VHKTGKDTRTGHSFAFAEFENPECAAAALACLNGYQYDPEDPKLGAMQLRFARPEARSTRGGGGGGSNPSSRSHPDSRQEPFRSSMRHSSPGGAGGAPMGGGGTRGAGSGSWSGSRERAGHMRGAPPPSPQDSRPRAMPPLSMQATPLPFRGGMPGGHFQRRN
jgi:hypothetical protein